MDTGHFISMTEQQCRLQIENLFTSHMRDFADGVHSFVSRNKTLRPGQS